MTLNTLARLIFHWAVNNLDSMVVAAFLASLLSLAFAAIQVRRKMKEGTLLTAENEIQAAMLPQPFEAPQFRLAELARQGIVMDTITLAALSGIQVAHLRRTLGTQERESVLRAAVPQISQEKGLGQGTKEDDTSRALVGGEQVLACN